MAEHVCPWWLGSLLASPVRRLWQRPEEILSPHVKRGMTVLEIGPGMGFFSLPMARMVGNKGKIICVDVQEQMLNGLNRRAQKAGLSDRIMTRLGSPNSLGISEYARQVDFILAFAVVHEVPNQENLFREIRAAAKDGASMLISEPRGHVTVDNFARMLELTRRNGFEHLSSPVIRRSIAALLRKQPS